MTKFLKGNYDLDATITEDEEPETGAMAEFERTALSRLGGSICFVRKQGFVWRGDDPRP